MIAFVVGAFEPERFRPGEPKRRPVPFMDVVKSCAAQGMQALNLGVPILADELARRRAPGR